MNSAAARTSAPPPVVFRDAFGERRRIAPPSGSDALDVLCLKSELTAVPSFEFALRERVGRLTGFRHPYFAHIRTVERLTDTARTLALISNAALGVRLSELLVAAAKKNVVLDSDAALCLIRQLVTAMATFHEQVPDAPHGALGPERIVVTPNARLVIVEHVLGSAVEQLQYSEDRYWRELRVPCPRAVGLPVVDRRTDVLQLGMVALALMLRRLLNADEFPSRIGDAVVSARAMSPDGAVEALPSGLRPWLTSALQLDPRAAFTSAIEAREGLEKVFEKNDGIGDPAALEAFMTRYHDAREPAPEQAPPQMAAEPVSQTSAYDASLREPEPSEVFTAPPPPLEPSRMPEPLRAPEPRLPEVTFQSFTPSFTPEPAPLVLEPIAASTVLPAKPHRSGEHVRVPRFDTLMTPAAHLEETKEPNDMPSTAQRRRRNRLVVAALVLVSFAGGGMLAARGYFSNAAAIGTTGTVAITTNPPGAQVYLDGRANGVTPTTLTVEAGNHVLELRGAGEPRSMTIDVPAGAQLSHYIEMGKGQLAVGSLRVRTEPAGARISVDGTFRGTSPVVVSDLTPGEHTVAVETEAGSTRQTVVVEAGAMASLVAQLPTQAGPASGWISVSTPKTVQLFEDGRLLGSSDSDRLMVSAGSHRLDIVNDSLGYRDSRTVQVAAGKVSTITVEFPKGTIALNAVPWADVWIDGEKVGETPIGNLSVTIGSHEIIFRHPELGEQRHLTTVTLSAPARLSVDMRKKQ